MSTRDEQPATVPPPAGEDDAYSATTKVGAMPADIMEKLRAEGLLPEDVEQEERAKAEAVRRPSTALDRRAPPRPGPPVPPPSEGSVPRLYSMPPPAPAERSDPPPSKMETAKPPPMEEAPSGEPMPAMPAPPDAIETPVAFAFPPASQMPNPSPMPAMSEEARDTTAMTARNMRAQGPSKTVMAVVAVLVVVLLIVALMRLRG